MSRRVGDVAIIKPEPEDTCELCGKFEETRPYGPGGKRVCFECGMKDEEEAKRQMDRWVFGESVQ